MRQVIKKRVICSAAEAVARGEQDSVQPALDKGRGAQAPKTPGVRLVHLDGRVHAVEVTCRCGDVSVLEIEYEA